MKIKSAAPAERGINVKGADGKPMSLVLQPGQEADVTLVNPKDPVFYGLVEKREILIAEAEQAAAQAAQATQEQPASDSTEPKPADPKADAPQPSGKGK